MPVERINDMALSYNKILLRMNHSDVRFQALVEAMTSAMAAVTKVSSKEDRAEARSELLIVMNEILKAEWERLKVDLVNSERSRELQ